MRNIVPIFATRLRRRLPVSLLMAATLLHVFACTDTVLAQATADNSNPPYLMLDTGGHSAIVRALAFTADGERLISGGDDKIIRIWDWQRGVTERQIVVPAGIGHFGRIYSIALSPDQKSLVVAADQRPRCRGTDCAHISVYNFASGKLDRVFKAGHRYAVLSLAFSPDGTKLLSSSLDETAIVWDWATGKVLHRLRGHADNIYRAAFTADGQRVVTASDDRTLRLWDVNTGTVNAIMTGHEAAVFRMAVSPKGDLIVSGGQNGELRLWSQATGAFIRTLGNLVNNIGALTFDATGQFVIAGPVPSTDTPEGVKVWNVESSEIVTTYPSHAATGIARAHPRENLVAVGDKSGQIHVWNHLTGEQRALLRGGGNIVWAVDLAPDGAWLGWGNRYERAVVNSRARITTRLTLPGGPWWWRRRLSAVEHILVPAYPIGLPRRYSQPDGKLLTLQEREGGRLDFSETFLDVVRNGDLIVTITRDESDGFRHASYGFAPGSDEIQSGGDNGHFAAFQSNGSRIGDYIGHDGTIWAIAATQDGELLASGGDDQTVRLWNRKTRELIATLLHSADNEWVMWTPQGYYTGSAKSGRMIGWLVETVGEAAPKFVQAADIPELNRKDILERAIEHRSARAAIDELKQREPAVERSLLDRLRSWTDPRPVPK